MRDGYVHGEVPAIAYFYEVRRQLAQDPMTTLKHVGDLMEIQQNDAKRARCDVHI